MNRNRLKLIACASMLIDHIAAGILYYAAFYGYYPSCMTHAHFILLYDIMRGIGRTAFPIFAYLLVDGFLRTRSRSGYALGLLFFGIISEIPYDVALSSDKDVFNLNIIELLKANKPTIFDSCNIYFTLLIGLLVIWGIEKADSVLSEKNDRFSVCILIDALIAAAGILCANLLHTDYHGYGIALIVIYYLFRFYAPLDLVAGYLFFCIIPTEYLAFPSAIFMYLYSKNKKQGKHLGRIKYFFYAFYPVHLIFIYLFRCLIFSRF